MRLFPLITCLTFALCYQTGSIEAGNFGQNSMYSVGSAYNYYFNGEYNFSQQDAEKLFMQEQNERQLLIIDLQKFKEREERKQYQLGSWEENAITWYTMVFKALRLVYKYRMVDFANVDLKEGKNRLNEEFFCRNADKRKLRRICYQVFENSFFQDKGWCPDLQQLPRCPKKKVVVGQFPIDYESERRMLECPAVYRSENGLYEYYFKIYISATDKRYENRLIYYLFMDDNKMKIVMEPLLPSKKKLTTPKKWQRKLGLNFLIPKTSKTLPTPSRRIKPPANVLGLLMNKNTGSINMMTDNIFF